MAESEKDIRANCLNICESCNLKQDCYSGCLNNAEIQYIQTDILEYSECSKFPVVYPGNYDKNKNDLICVVIDSRSSKPLF